MLDEYTSVQKQAKGNNTWINSKIVPNWYSDMQKTEQNQIQSRTFSLIQKLEKKLKENRALQMSCLFYQYEWNLTVTI